MDLTVMASLNLVQIVSVVTYSLLLLVAYLKLKHESLIDYSVADPGFSPGGGAPTPKIAIIFHIFAENCMKMKEFGPPGGARVPGAPPWIRQCYCLSTIATKYK